MKIILSVLSVLAFTTINAQPVFGDYFTDDVLRLDYLLAGNKTETKVYLNEMIKESHWGGPRKIMEKEPNSGEFRYSIYDQNSNKLLYSKGYNTLFNEWQTTNEAKFTERAFSMSAIMPFPKDKIKFVIERRNLETAQFNKIYDTIVDPKNHFIRPEIRHKSIVRKILKNGEPYEKVDIVFIAEGYTKNQMSKFLADVKRLVDYMFSKSPYTENKENFNIYAIESVSEESGTDIPPDRVYKNTILNSTFYTFNSERYLTTDNSWKMADIASNVPYDAIVVLVNTDKYGGGGFYNYYAINSAANTSANALFIHEFGHSFVGLADEYYTSDVAYNDMYNLNNEPWETNITTLVNFKDKWEHLIEKGTPIPTSRNDEKYQGKVGVFEGGGYASKGIYSPVNECLMKSFKKDEFCPACKSSIQKTIDYYIGK